MRMRMLMGTVGDCKKYWDTKNPKSAKGYFDKSGKNLFEKIAKELNIEIFFEDHPTEKGKVWLHTAPAEIDLSEFWRRVRAESENKQEKV